MSLATPLWELSVLRNEYPNKVVTWEVADNLFVGREAWTSHNSSCQCTSCSPKVLPETPWPWWFCLAVGLFEHFIVRPGFPCWYEAPDEPVTAFMFCLLNTWKHPQKANKINPEQTCRAAKSCCRFITVTTINKFLSLGWLFPVVFFSV